MRRPATLLFLLLLPAILSPAARADDHGDDDALPTGIVANAVALRNAGVNDTLAYELVASLTTEVGPRLAGSAGDVAAVRWARSQLVTLGFDRVRLEPVTVPRWERGVLDATICAPFPQRLVATMLGGSIGTDRDGLTAEVVRVESLDALRALPDAAVAGKIVFVDQQMRRARDGGGYGETVGIRTRGPSVSAAKGAVAHVIRSVGTDDHRTAHTGTLDYDDAAPRIPALAVSSPDADMITRQLATGAPVTLSIRSSARRLDDTVSYNVVGEFLGSSRPDEIVIMGAHLDSWDEGTGAIDDGAGVAIVTAAAKLIADRVPRPARTLRVVLFANEEFGLSGARKYREVHEAGIGQHVVGMEADLGAGAVWRFESRVAEAALPIITAIHELVAPLGVERGGNEAFGGADIGPLRAAGMPVFGIRQDATRYFDYHHTPGDTLDKIVPGELAQNVAVYAVAAYVAASIEDDFGRLPVAD